MRVVADAAHLRVEEVAQGLRFEHAVDGDLGVGRAGGGLDAHRREAHPALEQAAGEVDVLDPPVGDVDLAAPQQALRPPDAFVVEAEAHRPELDPERGQRDREGDEGQERDDHVVLHQPLVGAGDGGRIEAVRGLVHTAEYARRSGTAPLRLPVAARRLGEPLGERVGHEGQEGERHAAAPRSPAPGPSCRASGRSRGRRGAPAPAPSARRRTGRRSRRWHCGSIGPRQGSSQSSMASVGQGQAPAATGSQRTSVFTDLAMKH